MIKIFALPIIQKSIICSLLAVLLLTLFAPVITNGQTNNAPVGETASEGNAAAASIGVNSFNSVSTFYDDGIIRAQRSIDAANSNNTVSGTSNTGSTQQGATSAPGSTNAVAQSQTNTNPAQQVFNRAMFDSQVGYLIYTLFVSIGGMVVWVGGNILDYAIDKLVLGFGTLLTANFGIVVEQIWTVVRDFFNIIFIFALIWMGLNTILKSDDSDVQRNLGRLIIAALLINFSLFITKAIVDFSNIAAVQISNAMSVSVTGDSYDLNVPGLNLGNYRLSDSNTHISVAFADSMRLSSFAGSINPQSSLGQLASFGFMMMIVMIIAGFVFLAGGILLIIRFVALIIAMMFSPAMFLGFIYPKLAPYASKWWDFFLRNAFVAPVCLFMLYIVLYLIGPGKDGFGGINNGTFAVALGDPKSVEDGNFGVVLYFGVIIAMLIAAVKVSSSMSTHGSNMVRSVGMYGANKLYSGGKSLGMMPVNYTKRVGQNAGSAAYEKMALGFRGKDYDQAGKNLKERRARYKDGKASGWDKVALGYAAVRGAGSLDDRQAALQKGTEYKPFGGNSYKEKQSAKKQLASQNAQILENTTIKNAIAETNKPNLTEAAKAQNLIRMEDQISKASANDLIGIAKSKDGAQQIASIAGSISSNKWEKIMESEDISPENKSILAQGRVKSTVENIKRKAGSGEFVDGIKNASADELDTLDYNKLQANALYLQSNQMDDLRKKWGPEKFRILQSSQQKAFKAKPITEVIASRKNNKEVAKLPKDLLEQYEFITEAEKAGILSADLLDKIATESNADKRIIGDKIRNMYDKPENVPEWWNKFTKTNQGLKYTR